MTAAPAPSRFSWLARLGLLVLVSLVARGALTGVEIVDKDEAVYMVVARELQRGATLYVDVADHHPPGAYWFYAAVDALLGLGLAGVRLVANGMVVPLTALALSAFFRHDRRGLVAALAYVVYGATYLGHDMLAVNCEVLFLLPGCAALACVRDARAAARPGHLFAAGVLVGLAVLVKYQAATWLPAIALAAALEPWRARRIGRVALAQAALASGFALPLLAVWGAFHARGAGAAFLHWNLEYNFAYTASALAPAEAFERAAAYLVPWFAVTSPLWLAAARSWRARPGLDPYSRVLLGGVLAASLGAATLGLRFYPHYIVQAYAPLALVAAPWAASVLRAPLAREGRALLAVTALSWAGLSAANAWLYHATHVYVETAPEERNVSAYLRADACAARGGLFVWGHAPGFYYWSGLRPATRFVLVEAGLSGYVPGNRASTFGDADVTPLLRSDHWDWLMDDLTRGRPAFVLDTTPARRLRWNAFPLARYPRLRAFVGANYAYAGRVEGVDVWRRRDCPASAPAGPILESR